MVRRIACVVAVAGMASMAAGQTATPAAGGITVKACGLRVVLPMPKGEKDEMSGMTLGSLGGTTVALLASRPSGGIIAYDEGASKLTAFTDDKGGDLLEKEDGSGFGMRSDGLGAFATMVGKGKGAVIEINAKKLPGKGARAIKAKGELVFKVASTTKAYKQESVALKKGTKVSAGPVALTITKAGKPDWGDDPLQVEFEAKESVDSIAEVRFLDASGKAIEASGGPSGQMSFSGKVVSAEMRYTLKKKADAAAIEIRYWTDLKAVKAPFDVTVSVGLEE